ncbi:MAG: LytTR family DNA-binding domain-containing protein, partial [Ginsengibacter sp.]
SVIIYSFSMAVIFIYKSKILKPALIADEVHLENTAVITTLIVSDANNKKIVIPINDVMYFSANSPYINIHLESKKYLQKRTLKYLEGQLNSTQFLRVHKSCIINMHKVISYKSRLNGDYDITLSDNTQLRLSRNYLKAFKSAMEGNHGVT